MMRNVHSHLAVRQAGRNLLNEPPIGSISKRLDDMLSTPFCYHIIHYEPPRGFLVPKFSTYDGSTDPFDHIMHYRQLMTLDIGNDALLCKVFLASLQEQTLSWFHRLPPNSVDNFRDLSEAFVGQYLCSARHKQNISTLQNIKMQDNEFLREFVKRFGQAVLQVEACSMDAVLQIFKRSICPGLSDFRWPRPLGTDPSKRDHSKRCAFHKEHGHTTETCRCLHYLVERLIKAGHLKQYLRSDAGGKNASHNHNTGALKAPPAPKAVINYINGGPSDEEYDSKRKRQKLLRAASVRERINSIRPGLTRGGPRPTDGTIIFPPVDPTRTLQPHRDALILSLKIGDFDVRRILVDPSSSADLVQTSVVSHMGHSLTGLENPVRILSGFNGSSTTSLGNIILPVQAGPVTLNVQFSMDGQIDLYGNQLAARQCYQITREVGTSQEDAFLPESSHVRDQYQLLGPADKDPPAADPLQTIQILEESTHLTNISSIMTPEETHNMQNVLRRNHDVFVWAHSDMKEFIPLLPLIGLTSCHQLDPYVVVPKKEGKWRVCVDYTNLNNACPKDSFPLPRIDQIVDSTVGQGMLSFLDAFSGYHQIPISPTDEEKTAFITPHDLYCYRVMSFGLKNAGSTYQRLMTKIFKPLIGHTVEVYIDDIVVKSKTREEHVLHLQKVFHLLRKYDMKLNPSKCAFGVSAGKFLGFMVSQRGIEVSPEQVKAVMETPPPGARRSYNTSQASLSH
ncbi:Transposon Ty3-I Gag-Pol polyprotein [Vitis vinifera]|uniref:Transposon Ty3-I Gag-Pol polyprotein n=1 Tax=Vitis vinifera TaxID=29760 RepID=A0A438KI41_VITVI|nr:Transposon Ty3-I Gag-Pol polyprotein [Vitis vinifera]